MLQEFYKRTDKVIHLKTTREAINARKPAPTETPREIAPMGKSTPAEKGRENKKRKNEDH